MSRREVNIVVEGFGTLRAEVGCNLGEVLASKGLISLPCGGRGLCGQCIVYIKGEVPPRTGNEAARGLKGNYRLACRVRVYSDVVVKITRRPSLKVPKQSYEVSLRAVNPIYNVVDLSQPAISRRKYVPASTLYCTSGKALLIDGFIISSASNDFSNVLLVDLGTTKIMYQVRDSKANLISDGVILNPLHIYGADIITRVTKALKDPRVYAEMSASLHDLIKSLINREKAVLTVIAGNSVMESIFMGLPLKSLAEKPFQPVAKGPFIFVLPGTSHATLLAPLLAGFVGGDAFANLLAAEYVGLQKPYLIIDLGTNTEVLLAVEDKYFVASAPAGPAFEGHITSGVSSVIGGIEEVRISGFSKEGSPKFTWRGDPVGLLGSGVISLVAELVRYGLVNKEGRIIKGYDVIDGVKLFTITGGAEERVINFTYSDLRGFQKAMAAVKAGWRTVLSEGSVSIDDLKYVVLCGSFGSRISPEDAALLRLIPPVSAEKVVITGNLVLSGLKVYVFDKSSQEIARNILSRLIHVDLVRSENFMKLWIKSLKFEGAPSS